MIRCKSFTAGGMREKSPCSGKFFHLTQPVLPNNRASSMKRLQNLTKKPIIKLNRLLDRFREAREIFHARDFRRPQSASVRCPLLDIEQMISTRSQVIYEIRDGHFRSVADVMKHAFCGEKCADSNPVRTANELVA